MKRAVTWFPVLGLGARGRRSNRVRVKPGNPDVL
jgi:hypothetical protein